MAFKEKLSKLPRGTIYISKIYISSFVYRKHKESGKVISKYIGRLDDQKLQEAINKQTIIKGLKND